ncbi:uncharacterized protein LOC143576668 [Bidens hawaiensis]|uniref:uncharacterized protein LOC143576668 n=1 Tax=Bidens hawaiensis TaxID=980011 RepID=UPI00404B520A
MATSAFKSTTRRPPVTTQSEDSSSSKSHHRRSDYPEISLDDLAIEFFSNNGSELEEDDSVGSRRDHRLNKPTTASQRRSRSVSRHRNGNGADSAIVGANSASQRRGRSVSRRNDGNASARGAVKVVANADLRRRRSVSVARHQISDSESDIDFSKSSASQSNSRSMNNVNNSRVASFQRPTASSHRRLTRSVSQAPQLRSRDGDSSHSSAFTDDDLRDARYGRNETEKTIRAVYAQRKMEHPTGDDTNNGIYEAMRKEVRSAVNELMMEREQTMGRKPSALSVHDRLYLNKSDATRNNHTTKLKQTERTLEEHQARDEYKIVREVVPKSRSNVKSQTVSYTRKRSNDRNRMSKRLDEEAEKYFEDFISNVEDTDFSSFDGERSDTSSTLVGSATKQNSVPVEMEGVNLPWLKWDDNDGANNPTTPKPKLWDPSKDLELIREHGSSHGSWNPEYTPANSTNVKGNKLKENRSPRFDMAKYLELERTEELLLDSWRERSVIRSGGLLVCCPLLKPC